jgi:hypothetical protein
MPNLFMQGPTTFHLAAERKAEALALLQPYYDQHRPVASREVASHRAPFGCLEDGLIALGWEATCDRSGDITRLTYTREYFTDESDALEVIARCVTAGSSIIAAIEHEGELGFDIELWLFDGVRMQIIEADLSFASLPARNPERKSTPQVLVGLQQGLSLSLHYLLVLLRREPELARALEDLFLQEYLLPESSTKPETSGRGQASYTLGALTAAVSHLATLADTGD